MCACNHSCKPCSKSEKAGDRDETRVLVEPTCQGFNSIPTSHIQLVCRPTSLPLPFQYLLPLHRRSQHVACPFIRPTVWTSRFSNVHWVIWATGRIRYDSVTSQVHRTGIKTEAQTKVLNLDTKEKKQECQWARDILQPTRQTGQPASRCFQGCYPQMAGAL